MPVPAPGTNTDICGTWKKRTSLSSTTKGFSNLHSHFGLNVEVGTGCTESQSRSAGTQQNASQPIVLSLKPLTIRNDHCCCLPIACPLSGYFWDLLSSLYPRWRKRLNRSMVLNLNSPGFWSGSRFFWPGTGLSLILRIVALFY